MTICGIGLSLKKCSRTWCNVRGFLFVILFIGINPDSDHENAKAAAARALVQYVMAANLIYVNSVFGLTGNQPEGIRFAIKALDVYRTENDIKAVVGGLEERLIGVDRFLDLWSRVSWALVSRELTGHTEGWARLREDGMSSLLVQGF